MTTSIEHTPSISGSTSDSTSGATSGATSGSTHSGRVPLRLRVDETLGRSRSRRRGASAVDGVWWPQSRDFAVEVADLVEHLPDHLGFVNRVVFSRPDWNTAPRRVRLQRGWIKAGSYPGDVGPHRLMLLMASAQLIRLQVVASNDEPEASAEAHETVEVMDIWHDEGGSWWGANEVAPSDR